MAITGEPDVAGIGIGVLVAVGIPAAGPWPPAQEPPRVLACPVAGMREAWITGMPVVGAVASVGGARVARPDRLALGAVGIVRPADRASSRACGRGNLRWPCGTHAGLQPHLSTRPVNARIRRPTRAHLGNGAQPARARPRVPGPRRTCSWTHCPTRGQTAASGVLPDARIMIRNPTWLKGSVAAELRNGVARRWTLLSHGPHGMPCHPYAVAVGLCD